MHFSLEGWVPDFLWVCFVAAFFLSICWRPIAGLYYLMPLIPLQTVRYRVNDHPLGTAMVTLVLLSVVMGLIRRRQPLFGKGPGRTMLLLYSGFLLLSYCLGSFYLGHSFPVSLGDPRLAEWKDYMLMPLLFFLVRGAVTTRKEAVILLGLLCLGVLLVDKGAWGAVANGDYSSYSDDLRDPGPMGYAGANGLAAFEAQSAVFMLALAGFGKQFWLRLGAYAIGCFSAVCTMYSLSRGAYVAFGAGFLLLGLLHQRKLLVALTLFVVLGSALIPAAVVERVLMTQTADGELDHSSETRVELWGDAMQLFESNPAIGTGFLTYAYLGRVGNYKDTHNIYLKVLAETGVTGLVLFLCLLGSFISIGVRLCWGSTDPLYRGLGLGTAMWVFSSAVANCFGDRWMYLQVNGYMWVLAGLSARCLMFGTTDEATDEATDTEAVEDQLSLAAGAVA